MFIRRGGSGDDPWLNQKLWTFTIGAVVALVGMLLDNLWVMAAAGLILVGGVALRFIPRADGGDFSDHMDAGPDGDT